MNLSPESRHFVKEMQTIRNRWAHTNTEGVPVEDVYRDLDTLQRFAAVVESGEDFIQEIRATKKSLLAKDAPPASPPSLSETPITQKKETLIAEFKPGQMIRLKSNPDIRGAVVSVTQGQPENRYDVFILKLKKFLPIRKQGCFC